MGVNGPNWECVSRSHLALEKSVGLHEVPLLVTTIRLWCQLYHCMQGYLDVGQVCLSEVVKVCISK